MDPELQKSLADLLAYVKQGADLAIDQAPAVAQEIIRYQIVKGAVVSIMCALTGVAALMVARHCRSLAQDETAEDWERRVYTDSHSVALLFGWFIALMPQLFTTWMWLRPLIAPRLVIIEYLGHAL